MSDEPRDPSLETVLSALVDQILDSAQCMLIVRVTAYDPVKQKVSVRPVVRKSHLNEFDELVRELPPEIHEVPVAFDGNAKGRITVPVAVGDYGMAFFSSVSIARWKLTGGNDVDPGDDRRHDINDCVFRPGVHDFAHVPTTAPVDAIVLHAGDGIKVKVGGPTGTEPTLMGDTFVDRMDTWVDALAGILDSAVPGSGTTISTAWDEVKAAGLKTTKTEVK